VAQVIAEHFVLESKVSRYDRAVGRDYSHSDAPGCTIYIGIKKPKEASV